MPDQLSQDDRVGVLTTPLGKDKLVLSHFTGTEGMSALGSFNVEALSESQDVNFDEALGKNCCVALTTVDGKTRNFNGMLVDAHWVGSRNGLYVFRLVLRPWPWLLGFTSNCRIFANQSVVETIKQVCHDHGFDDLEDKLTTNYPKLEYCVQYRESDLNFVSRLMEEYGIYYYFEHSADKHVMVLADGRSSHTACPDLSEVPYLPSTVGSRRDQQQFLGWATARNFTTGRHAMKDFDYNKPPTNLLADKDQSGDYNNGSLEMFDYPGRYTEHPDGVTLTQVRLQAAQVRDQRRSSVGSAPSLFPGTTFGLTDHPAESENTDYLVAHCSHSFGGQNYSSGGGQNGVYSGSYEMAKADKPFRAPLAARRPIIAGPQSAKVIGKEGEEIDVDELGRILVQFYWDREKKPSRRVRVAQTWSGKNRGALFLPRIGDEVMIAYEDGDPDKPLVVGSVYNGTNTVPMTLPDKKVKSGILTQSSKGGDGYHMMLFDDTAGSEVVKLRSQKDLMVKALHNETRQIGVDQSEDIGADLRQTVGGDKSVQVGGPKGGGKYTMTAQQKIVLTVASSSITIDPSGITIQAPTITLNGDVSISATAPSVSVTGDAEVTITSPATSISG